MSTKQDDTAYTPSFFQTGFHTSTTSYSIAINDFESLQMYLYDIQYPLQSDKLKKLFSFLEKCQNTPDSKSIVLVSSLILAKSIEQLISLQLSLKHIKVNKQTIYRSKNSHTLLKLK